jgi:3-hydroxy-9,10-secoandrosta-1,3,5(10)-triene-9,17-dione monooxygenase reductase component
VVFDLRELRNAFGCFPTGVTVVTGPKPGGGHVGFTANSFSSVSLDPPMLLVSLARNADCFLAFMEAPSFAVNVLAADQEGLSRHFASKSPDKFAGLEVAIAGDGAALIEGCVAHFLCRVVSRYEAGDHVILVGGVTAFKYWPDRPPLVFARGRYGQVLPLEWGSPQ